MYHVNGYEIGGQLRTYEKEARPKVVAYKHNPELPWASWYLDYRGGPLVIVEDQLSAIRVSQSANALALLGTHLSAGVVQLIQRLKPQPTEVILALDPDAFEPMLEIQAEYDVFLPNLRLVMLSKDPKDMTNDEIRGVILGKTDTSSSVS